MTAEEVANRNQTSIGAIKAIVFRMRTKAKKIAKENPNFLLIAPYLLILLGASKKWKGEIDVDATSMALCHTKVEEIRRRISEGELTAQQIHDILISEIENELNRPTKEVNMAYVKICEELLSSLGADDEPLVDQY